MGTPSPRSKSTLKIKSSKPWENSRWSKSKIKPAFRVSTRRAGARVLKGPANTTPKAPEEELGMINGVRANNKYEWRMARALWNANYQFDYQVSVMGGRSFIGGQVVDFLVYTVPRPTPVFVDGEHWHEGEMAKEDAYKRLQLETTMDGTWNPPVAFFGPELHTYEQTWNAVLFKLGRQ